MSLRHNDALEKFVIAYTNRSAKRQTLRQIAHDVVNESQKLVILIDSYYRPYWVATECESGNKHFAIANRRIEAVLLAGETFILEDMWKIQLRGCDVLRCWKRCAVTATWIYVFWETTYVTYSIHWVLEFDTAADEFLVSEDARTERAEAVELSEGSIEYSYVSVIKFFRGRLQQAASDMDFRQSLIQSPLPKQRQQLGGDLSRLWRPVVKRENYSIVEYNEVMEGVFGPYNSDGRQSEERCGGDCDRVHLRSTQINRRCQPCIIIRLQEPGKSWTEELYKADGFTL
ncbi:hypothetical protein L218DRAFT_992519 [Marasmius fiardii PR-910]|nr:hypothetical protein L218DRAFT_992519 [Marasmius fiardii PR-910]